MPAQPTVEAWIAREAIPFALDTPASVDSATDRVMAELGPGVDLLGLGEALHGSEEILLIRNRVFQRLVERHGYSAVVLEVTSPRARAIDAYVLGERERSEPKVEEWFGNGFGQLEANRELIEWLRHHNADSAHATKLHFYGF